MYWQSHGEATAGCEVLRQPGDEQHAKAQQETEMRERLTTRKEKAA